MEVVDAGRSTVYEWIQHAELEGIDSLVRSYTPRARKLNDASCERLKEMLDQGRLLMVIWPEVKKKAAERGATLVFIDETGWKLSPSVEHTWENVGRQTPVVKRSFRRDKPQCHRCRD